MARDPDRARSSRHSSSSSISRSHWPGPVQLPEWIDEERAPSHFKCPITLCVMREPAVTPAGITYERSALMQWLDHQHVEPSTKRRLKRSHVVPNLTLRAMIEDWLQHERDVRAGKASSGAGLAPTGQVRGPARPGSPRRGGGVARGQGRPTSGSPAHVRRAQGTSRAGRVLRGAAMGGVYAARGRGDEGANDDGTQLDGTPGSNVASATGDGSEEARAEVAGSNPGGGERLDVESSSLSSPPTPAVSREEEIQPLGSLDATLDDDAMND